VRPNANTGRIAAKRNVSIGRTFAMHNASTRRIAERPDGIVVGSGFFLTKAFFSSAIRNLNHRFASAHTTNASTANAEVV
jgi:hypothetical protein